MPLTDTQIKNAKPQERQQKLFDGGGLFLLVVPEGGKRWRLKYRFGGKEKLLALGTYPQVSLKEAREQRDAAKKMIREGIDPGEIKKEEKAEEKADKAREENTFRVVAVEWIGKQAARWTESHREKTARRFELDVFPWIGDTPIVNLNAPVLLEVVQRIEKRGAVETAHRVLQNCGQLFRYAIATGRAERNPAADLRGALAPVQEKHFATITEPGKIGALLRAMDGYEGSFVVRCALKLAPLVVVRPGELRKAEWAEFDLTRKEWRIPAEKMKMRDTHIVPLSPQAVAVLEELHPLTGKGAYLFPSERTPTRPMSENTVNGALRRMGYSKEELTGHGFRAMFSTLAHEHGWPSDVIERQLAHAERNSVKKAYNHAQHLPERRKLLEWWGEYLEGLK